MNWVFGAIVATLGVVFLWGLFAPRSQWRALAGWSVSDPHANEPSGTSYGIRRFLFGLGALAMAIVFISSSSGFFNPPQQAAGLTSAELMWGAPEPRVVNRVVTPLAAPPEGLVEVPVLGYQDFDEDDGTPSYVRDLTFFTMLGRIDIPGYIGVYPGDEYSAASTAELVLNVRGALLCVPRQAVVIETETTVQVAVYYGLPDAPDGSVPDNATNCAADSAVTVSLLLPIELSAPLGDREVQTLDGTKVRDVPIAD